MGVHKIRNSNRTISVFILAILMTWILAFSFEGQILFALAWHYQINIKWLIFFCAFFYCSGALISDFIIKNSRAVKQLIMVSTIMCILTSGICFFHPGILWYVFLLSTIFLVGCSSACWSLYYVEFSASNDRLRTAADVLIYNNIGLFIIGLAVVFCAYAAGLLLIIFFLVIALLMAGRLPKHLELPTVNTERKPYNRSLIKAVLLLFLFIFVVSINMGLAYQVLLPSFYHLGMMVHFYWSIPYLVSLIIIRNLPQSFNRNYLLYVAIAMLGFAYMGFMIMDRSLLSFLVICSITFLAKGVFDLFWLSIIGGMLDLTRYPIRILGGGIAFNTLGLMFGSGIGSFVFLMRYDSIHLSIIALTVVFITLMLMPPLHNELSGILQNHIYLNQFSQLPAMEQTNIIKKTTMIDHLTERESEIADLLMRGRTYKMISAELFLSENTVKTHIKNIYSKLQIRNKTELINILMEQYTMEN